MKATREGQAEGHEPRVVILNAVRACTDVLEDSYDGLEPTVEITRVGDGVFEGEIDTHGLGDIHVRIARAD